MQHEYYAYRASLDKKKIDLSRIPDTAIERLTIVENEIERFALTKEQIQNGDVVKQQNTGQLYFVINDNKLNSEDGYTDGMAVNIPWTEIIGKPLQYPPIPHTHEGEDTISSVNHSLVSEKCEREIFVGSGLLGGGSLLDDVNINVNFADPLETPTNNIGTICSGSDERLYNDRNAADVYGWAKTSTLLPSAVPNLDVSKLTTGVLETQRGGTGISSYTTNNYIRSKNTNELEQRTPDQVRTDINAAITNQIMHIGTTSVNINRSSGTLNLTGIGTLECGAISSTSTITTTELISPIVRLSQTSGYLRLISGNSENNRTFTIDTNNLNRTLKLEGDFTKGDSSVLTINTNTGNKIINFSSNQTRTYTIPDVANSNFVMTQGAQTISGNITFSNTITGSINGNAETVPWSGVSGKPSTFTPSSHNNTAHSTNYAAEAITITAGTGLTGGGNLTANRTLNVSYGTAAGTACQGNDGRLSNARTPTAHTHTLANITDSGNLAAINTNASTANYLRGDGSWVTPPNTTYSAMSVAEGQTGTATSSRAMRADHLKSIIEHRITNTDPKSHTHNYAGSSTAGGAANSVASTLTRGTGLTGNNFNGSAATTWAVSYGTAAGTACQGNDSRLSNARTPTTHTHGGGDITSAVANATTAANCSRQIIAGTGCTGGGALTANRTINVTYGTTAGTACQGNDSRLADDRTRKTTVSTANPSGGADGDIWLEI